MKIQKVTESDLDELLPLVRAYCDFYGGSPTEGALRELSRALLAAPESDGFQLLAWDDKGQPVGFATVYWSWSTVRASRIGILNDLFVSSEQRRSGIGTSLIERCRAEARSRGAAALVWDTAKDNVAAQELYERLGAERSEEWVDYSLSV